MRSVPGSQQTVQEHLIQPVKPCQAHEPLRRVDEHARPLLPCCTQKGQQHRQGRRVELMQRSSIQFNLSARVVSQQLRQLLLQLLQALLRIGVPDLWGQFEAGRHRTSSLAHLPALLLF